jgi:hypothetical protein
MHLLFCCPPAKEMWHALGLKELINEVASLDRSGSAVLEYILRRNYNNMPGILTINLKKWYWCAAGTCGGCNDANTQ